MIDSIDREDEVEKLKALQHRVPQYSSYPTGPQDDHWSAIHAQIWTIEQNPSEHELLAEARERGWWENVTVAALDALDWLDNGGKAPSQDWETLATKQPTK